MSTATPKVTFAQLCKNLPEIVDGSQHHVFELYQTVTAGASYPFTETGQRWDISGVDFLKWFYQGSGNTDGAGAFRLFDCCNNFMSLHNWSILDYPFVNPGSSTDVSYNRADILTLVPQQWVLDLSHNTTDCWTACSYMQIMRELIPARNLCNWNCNVCCCLSTAEIADLLNQQDPSPFYIVGAPYYIPPHRTPKHPIRPGDVLVLAVLFTNPNVQAKPIELRLNFHIII